MAIAGLPQLGHWRISAEYRCPTLVIQGAGDEYGTLEQVDRIERGVGGNFEKLILEACGHAPHRDQADAVLAAVARYVEA